MRYIILVFLGACSYGVLSTFVKLAYESGFGVAEVVGSQTLLGVVIAWPLALLYSRRTGSVKRENRAPIKWGQVLKLILVGLNIGLTSILYYGALQYISASLAIVLLFQFTWLGVLLEAVVKRRRPEAGKIYALIVLLAGTVLASGIYGDAIHETSWLGVGLALLSAVTYTLFIWFSGHVAIELPPMNRSALMLTGAALLCMVVYPPAFLINGSLPQGLWLWGGLLALFGAVIPPLFFTIGVRHIGSGLASILGAAELPVAVCMAFIFLNEWVTVLQWIGVIITLIGVSLPELISRLQKRNDNKARNHPN